MLQLAEQARASKRGIWKNASSLLAKFDSKLRYRKGGPIDAAKDVGPVIMPKLFRRLSTYSVEKKAGIVSGTFPAFLQEHPDDCFETADFLSQGPTAARHRKLHEFVSKKSVLTVGAGGLVFQEKGSVVVGQNGKPPRW